MAFIDGTVVNVALPTLQTDLNASLADVQWVIEAYSLLLAALLWVGAVPLRNAGRGPGPAGGGGGGPRQAVNFFVLPSGSPAAVDVPMPPSVQLTSLPALSQIKVDLPKLDLGQDSGSGTGGTPGPGASPGRGTGSAEGPGTGGEGDYIVIASPRTMILPPQAPGSVAGHTYRIRFSVAADGRVTRVEIDPPIADEAYRREFLERMLAYQFVPAQTRDKRNVASVFTVTLRIGH